MRNADGMNQPTLFHISFVTGLLKCCQELHVFPARRFAAPFRNLPHRLERHSASAGEYRRLLRTRESAAAFWRCALFREIPPARDSAVQECVQPWNTAARAVAALLQIVRIPMPLPDSARIAKPRSPIHQVWLPALRPVRAPWERI